MLDFLKRQFLKTKEALGGKIRRLFKGPWDDSTFDELEKILYEADLGTTTALELVEATRSFLRKNKDAKIDRVLEHLAERCQEILSAPPTAQATTGSPRVILVVGVNGSGKTTTIAKVASKLQSKGESVMLAAGDTFRAAAIDQLTLWGERLNIPIISSKPNADPAAVAFDAVSAAKARNIDTVMIDTAGRLQNKTELMHQLDKMKRAIQKVVPDAPHETLLVVDATTGQNALDQAEVFNAFTPLTGIALTKLDGSAKGGVIVGLYQKLGIPIQWIGIGEGMDDLMPFEAKSYTKALFDL